MSDANILVIDDEENIRMTLQKTLSKQGYEVETALNGEDGLEKARKSEPDLILLDLKLPGMDGLEVLEKLEDHPASVIMITGYGSVETAVKSMKSGAIDYLRKPFSPDEIREIVSEVLERRKLEPREPEKSDYETCIELAKKMINEKKFEQAEDYLEAALASDPSTGEPFNLLGVILEMRGETTEALKKYRAALALDPSYKPAEQNIERATQFDYSPEGIKLDEETEADTGDKN